jgi:hypothetical protein
VVWARCWVLRERATKVERFVSAGRINFWLVWQTYVWDWPDVVTHLMETSGCGRCQCGLVLPVA